MNMDILNELLKIQEQRFQLIKDEWGYSSVQLKKWLEMYDKDYIRGDKETFLNIKVNILLPYTKTPKQMFYGEYAIQRLELAILAKAIIMMVNSNLEEPTVKERFILEAFHLFLRINSLKTLELTYERFGDIVMNSYNKVINAYNNSDEWNELVNYIQDKCEFYKPKRTQTLYHYKLEDFEIVKYCDTWKEAYIKWCNEVYPTLLDKYKEEELNKYKQHLQVSILEGHKVSTEQYTELMNKRKAKLDLLKINKPKSEKQFKQIIDRLKKN